MINKKYNNTLNDDIQSNNSSINENRNTFNTLSKTANFGNDKSNNKNENTFRQSMISTNSVLEDIMDNLRKKDRKEQEQIRDYLKKNKYNIPVTIKEDPSEFSDEIKTNNYNNNYNNMNNNYNNNNNNYNNNNNRDDMSNLPFDDFSEINSRQNSRLPTLRDK